MRTTGKSIIDLQEKLLERDDTTEMEKSRIKEVSPKKAGPQREEFSNPAQLLKQRLQKWINVCL